MAGNQDNLPVGELLFQLAGLLHRKHQEATYMSRNKPNILCYYLHS